MVKMQPYLLYFFIKTLTGLCQSVCMTKQKPNQQQGFIALFFTLGISSILLAYVYASSASTFEFMRTRQSFRDTRNISEHNMKCADGFADILVRSHLDVSEYVFVFEQEVCTITQIQSTHNNFSFIRGHVFVTGTIYNGFISSITAKPISL